MIDDFNNFSSKLNYDVCIIGGGAAGITLARELGKRKKKVVLLEGGSLQNSQPSQSLYQGETEGNFIEKCPRYMEISRRRYFGGSTNAWFGQCYPLAEHDFEEKNWISNSGWPISKSDLAGYYSLASKDCFLEGFSRDGKSRFDNNDFWLPKNKYFNYETFQIAVSRTSAKKKRISFSHYKDELEKSDFTEVYLKANCLRINHGRNNNTVNSVTVNSLDGKKRVNVTADYYVLAMGAIENPRILLASNDVIKDGIGNSHGNIGRYFLEHKRIIIGQVALWPPKSLKSFTHFRGFSSEDKKTKHRAFLVPTPEFCRIHKILNFRLSLNSWKKPTNFDLALLDNSRLLDRFSSTQSFLRAPREQTMLVSQLEYEGESQPKANNRLLLSKDRDRFGIPKARLKLSYTDLERDTFDIATANLTKLLFRTKIGRIRLSPNLVRGNHRNLGVTFHPSGGTRMGDNIDNSVVDKNSKVHSVNNLFVAGSSVFPTQGHANPTLTIVALAHRLADHLTKLLPS